MINNLSVERIIIRSPNWLGDAMMTTPAVSALRQIYPKAYISIVTKSNLSDVWKYNLAVNEVIESPKSRSLGSLLQFGKILQEKKFGLGILFTNSISSTLEFYFGKIPVRVGYQQGLRGLLLTHGIRSDVREHQIERSMRLIKELGEIKTIPEMFFPGSGNGNGSVDKVLGDNKVSAGERIIGINPGAAYGTAKRWMPEGYIELGKRLIQDNNARIVLFGGEKDYPFIQEIAEKISPNVINLAGKTNLLELGDWISRCSLYITNDSGPMHITMALKVPLVAIFGSTDERETGPYGSTQYEIVQKKVECAPCLLRECPIDHRCMTRISVDEVYQSCKNLLG